MIVVDASCLYEVVVGSPNSSAIAQRLETDRDQVAPHIVDVEVFGLIRRDFLAGRLESSMAEMAVDDLRSWPGERIGHRALLSRMLELSDNVRGWDAADRVPRIGAESRVGCPARSSSGQGRGQWLLDQTIDEIRHKLG